MTNATDALAALGISPADTPAPVAAENPVSTEATTSMSTSTPAAENTAETDETAFTVAGEEDVSFDEIPAMERGFSSSRTKYGFEDIAAPGTGGKKYHGKLIKFEGGDQDKFKRSVQSGATGQNAKAKEAGAPNYYVTRTHEVDGKFVGLYVIRTDVRPAGKSQENMNSHPQDSTVG